MKYALPAAAVLTVALLPFAARDRSEPAVSAGSIVPLTSFPGSELYPTLSPDAAQVVYSWDSSGGSYDLYLHAIGSDVPRRITDDAADDLSPSWSPDGRSVAFLRYHSEREAGVYVLHLPGGPERRVATVRVDRFGGDLMQRYGSRLAWHPDGKWLVVSEAGPKGLVLVPAGGGEKRVFLAKEESGWDEAPSFAPDGRALAFVRVRGWATGGLFRIGLTEELEPLGEPERLTDSPGWIASPVWSPDGESIYYLSGFRRTHLWRIRHEKHEPLRDLLGRASFLSAPRVEADGRARLAFSRRTLEYNIWSLEDDGSGEPARPSKMPPFLNSARVEVNPQFSPDGKRVAFMSTRSGVAEVWVCDVDGRNPLQLTDFGEAHVGGPRWSPDGATIVFVADVGGSPDIYSTPAGGGPVRRLTDHPASDRNPSWSRDGDWIYFTSYRNGGEWQVWRMPAGGGPAVQITQEGAVFALESLDGTRLFFSASSSHGHGVSALRTVPIEGGEEITVVDPIADVRAFTVVEEGLYFVETPAPHGGSRIGFYEFETGRIRRVAELDAPANWGITAYPLRRASRRTILYAQLDRSESDIYLIENPP